MTEIAFLVELALYGKLHKTTRDKVLSRIQECEQALTSTGRPVVHRPVPSTVPVQAASTQALLDAQNAQVDAVAAQLPPSMVLPSGNPVPTARRIIGGEVATGNGTKGPRKF